MENKQIQKETRNLNKYIGTDFRCNFKSSLSFGRKMDFQIKQVFFFFNLKFQLPCITPFIMMPSPHCPH